MMFEMAGGMSLTLHAVTGVVAILLMLIHTVWATIVVLRREARLLRTFHRFSLAVWLIWLVPYFSPMILGAQR